jgi:hypothetical protein
LSSSWLKDFSLFESTAETPNAVTAIWTQIERRQVMGWDSDLMGTTAGNSTAGTGQGQTRNTNKEKEGDIPTYRII